jgi:hypothetical protein
VSLFTQSGAGPSFSSFLPLSGSDVDAELDSRIPLPGERGVAWVCGGVLVGRQSLHSRDFVLPELIWKAESGEWVVSDCSDAIQRSQVLELAKIVREHREFDSLPLAEQHLEERRYRDFLLRKVKKGADPNVLTMLLQGRISVSVQFREWWSEKEERRRRAPLQKANRLANCGVTGRRMDCTAHPEEHQYYAPFNCGCRYCGRCGNKIFSDFFNKYLALWPIVEKLVVRPGVRTVNRICTLDFTARNLGRMPQGGEIQEFNQDIRTCLKSVMRKLGISSHQFLFLWCDEFGGWDPKRNRYNTNLHAHGVYVGPWLPWDLLHETWMEIRKDNDGALGVFIKRQKLDRAPADLATSEHARFARALGHALKYTGKHLAVSDGERLGQLEAAFHGVRRVHAMGLAYKADLICHEPCSICGAACEGFCEHDGEHSCKRHRASNSCPLCAAPLMFHRLSAYTSISVLKKEGRKDLDETRKQVERDRVLAGPRGSPSLKVPAPKCVKRAS